MQLIRFNPVTELDTIRSAMKHFVDDTLFNDNGLGQTTSPWMPATNIHETPNHLVYTVELPGFAREDVEVTIDRGELILRGERKHQREDGVNYHYLESRFGRFSRRLKLPDFVHTDKVNAKLTNGILTIELPKKEEQKTRQIQVTVK